jgi:hypothetical protein
VTALLGLFECGKLGAPLSLLYLEGKASASPLMYPYVSLFEYEIKLLVDVFISLWMISTSVSNKNSFQLRYKIWKLPIVQPKSPLVATCNLLDRNM